MTAVARVLILLVAFVLVTLFLGWWTIALVGGLWGLVARRGTWPAATAAVAAGLGWALLLAWAAFRGPVLDLAGKVGTIMQLPGLGIFAITVLFPMVLAGSAAMLVGALRPRRRS